MPSARYNRDLLESCLQLRPAADLDRMAQEAESSVPTEPDPETWHYQGTIFAFCGKKQAALHLLRARSNTTIARTRIYFMILCWQNFAQIRHLTNC